MLHLFKKIYLATDNIVDVNFDRVVISDTHGLDVVDTYKLNHGKLIAYGKDLSDIVGEGKKYTTIVQLFESLAVDINTTGKRVVIYADDQAFAKVIAHWYKLAFANPDKDACQTLYENAVYRYQVFYKGRFSRNVGNTDLTHTIDTSAFGDAFDNAVIDADEKRDFITMHKSEMSVEFMLATYFAGKTDIVPDLKNAIKHLMKKDLEKYFYELKEIFWVHFQTKRFTDKLGFTKTYDWSNFKEIENEPSKYAQLMLNDRLWKYKYMNFATTGDNINIEVITAEDVTAFEEYTEISGACWGEEEIYKHIKSDINKMAFLDIFDEGIKKDGFTDQRLEDLLEMEEKFENAAGSFFSIDLETVNHYFMQTLILNRTDTEFVSKYSIL